MADTRLGLYSSALSGPSPRLALDGRGRVSSVALRWRRVTAPFLAVAIALLVFCHVASGSVLGSDGGGGGSKSIKARRLARAVASSPLLPQQQPRLQTDNQQTTFLALPSNEDTGAFSFPPHLCHAPLAHAHIVFYSWDDLFPGLGFSAVFNSNSAFRTLLRVAARRDFSSSGAASGLANDLRSSLSASWFEQDGGARSFPATTAVLAEHLGVPLTGNMFFGALFELCPALPARFCSWMDIVGVQSRHVAHSWHQDSGREQRTAMIGFPPCNNYTGLGVFSHALKLSHRLVDPPPDLNRPRLWDDVVSTQPPEELIVRPAYIPGVHEILVYDDRDIFHSAPDWAHRASVWRIM